MVRLERAPFFSRRLYGLPLWLRALLLNSLVFEMGHHRLGILAEALNNYSSSYTASRLVTKRDALRTEGEDKYPIESLGARIGKSRPAWSLSPPKFEISEAFTSYSRVPHGLGPLGCCL